MSLARLGRDPQPEAKTPFIATAYPVLLRWHTAVLLSGRPNLKQEACTGYAGGGVSSGRPLLSPRISHPFVVPRITACSEEQKGFSGKKTANLFCRYPQVQWFLNKEPAVLRAPLRLVTGMKKHVQEGESVADGMPFLLARSPCFLCQSLV